MKKMLNSVVMVALLGLFVVGCADRAEPIEGDDLLVLNGVTLIDGTGAAPRENTVIVVQGDRILRVGEVGQFLFPNDATILDLDGRYATPGFIDTHVHSRVLDQMGSTLLGFGITTIRSPGDENGVQMRDRLESGALVGPTLLTAGRIIDHPDNQLSGDRIRLETEPQVRAEVRRQAAQGVDYVKVYMGISGALLEAAIDEAHTLGVKVIGHLHRASWTQAVQAGIDVLVHSGSEGPTWELLDGDQHDRFPWGDFKDYLLAWSETAGLVDLEGSQMNALVRLLVDNGVELNPTLVVVESLYWGNDTALLERLEPAYAPTALTQTWGENWQQANPFMRQWNLTNEEWDQLKRAFDHTKEMIRHFHERGVLITAGSDVAMPWITPGVSFHRELELLVSSGIPPLDVLTIATSNGARALGISDEVGTVEVGKRADLLVLRADPLKDIRNTREIDLLIMNGDRYEPSTLLP